MAQPSPPPPTDALQHGLPRLPCLGLRCSARMCSRAYVRPSPPSMASLEPSGGSGSPQQEGEEQAAARFLMAPEVRQHVCKYVYAQEW